MSEDGVDSVLHGEILEQPEAVARLLARERRNAAALAALWRRADIPFVLVAARGTSDNAARYVQYAFGLSSRLPVALAAPSLVTLYGVPPRLKGALVIGISQSGRSPDIVETIAAARRQGSPTLAIVNDPESPLARAADDVLPLHAGSERSVAATKTYTAELAAVAPLVLPVILVSPPGTRPEADSAAGLVGDSGDLRQLTFEGAKTFSAEELRDGLKWTPDFLEISHPMAPRGEFLKAVERKLLFGYQHGGFPEARISVQADAKSSRIIVKVEEGPRYVCGRVKVSGTKKAVSSAITRRLTVESAPAASAGRAFDFTDQAPTSPAADGAEPAAPGQIEALWVKGQPAPFSEYDLRWLEWQARQALGDQGFFFPEVHVAIQRDAAGGKAELEVKVLKEGPRRTIGSIEITGNKKNSREALLRYLDLKPGMELTPERVSGIEDRLWRSARFLAYQVTPGQPDTAGRVALHVEVSECDQAPPVDQEFSPVEQAMLNMRQWLARLDRRQEEMILDLTMDAVRLPGLEMIITPQSGLAALEKPAPHDAHSQRPSGFILKPNLAEFFATGRDRKLVVPWYEQQIWTRISLVSEKPEGESAGHHFNFSMGAGFQHGEEAAKVPYQLQVTLYPVVCVSMAHFTNCAYWFSGGMLICSNATTLCRLEARSGRPIELSWKELVKDKPFQAQMQIGRA